MCASASPEDQRLNLELVGSKTPDASTLCCIPGLAAGIHQVQAQPAAFSATSYFRTEMARNVGIPVA